MQGRPKRSAGGEARADGIRALLILETKRGLHKKYALDPMCVAARYRRWQNGAKQGGNPGKWGKTGQIEANGPTGKRGGGKT